MKRPRTPSVPKVWTDRELENQTQLSLDHFVERRLKEPDTEYEKHLQERRGSLLRLFSLLRQLDPKAPDVSIVREILLDAELQASFRYIAGPPISDDDLKTVVTRSGSSRGWPTILANETNANNVLKLICRMADKSRFPWVRQKRPPRPHELKQAIRATAALHAAQTMQTARRGYGREVEKLLRRSLEKKRFKYIPASNSGKILSPIHYPPAKHFYGECELFGRKTDLLVGLSNGRIVAIEAKDSSSPLNSVKRVLNDTAAKAKHWKVEAGNQVVPVALLSGVFGVNTLSSAQRGGLFLIWAHDFKKFVAWISSQ